MPLSLVDYMTSCGYCAMHAVLLLLLCAVGYRQAVASLGSCKSSCILVGVCLKRTQLLQQIHVHVQKEIVQIVFYRFC